MESHITDKPREPAPAVVAFVEYSLEPEEYVAGYLFVWEKALRKRLHIAVYVLIGYAIPFLILVGIAVEFVREGVRNPLTWIVLIPFLVGSYLLVVAQSYMAALPVRRAVRRRFLRKFVQGRYAVGAFREGRRDRVWLTSVGFTEANDFSQAADGVEITERKEFRVGWLATGSIDVTDGLAIFIVTGKGYLLVPRRAFPNEGAFHHFVHTAEHLQQAAERGVRSVAPPPPSSDPSDGLQRQS